MKKLYLTMAALLLALVVCTAVGTAWAYFTTYAEARGGYPIELSEPSEPTTTPEPTPSPEPTPPPTPPTPEEPTPPVEETFSAWTKHVSITNNESFPVFVRARAFCGSTYTLTYTAPEGGWTGPDASGWYEYGPLEAGASTKKLDIKIGNVPDDPEDGETFNVTVVYEYVPVQYTAAGAPYADWTLTLTTGGGA